MTHRCRVRHRRNRAILSLLDSAGFELVRSLKVWGQSRRSGTVYIMDNVFLNVAHFGFGAGQTEAGQAVGLGRLPRETLQFLRGLPSQRRFGINTQYVKGRTGQRYVVRAPQSLFICDPTSAAASNRTDIHGC